MFGQVRSGAAGATVEGLCRRAEAHRQIFHDIRPDEALGRRPIETFRKQSPHHARSASVNPEIPGGSLIRNTGRSGLGSPGPRAPGSHPLPVSGRT